MGAASTQNRITTWKPTTMGPNTKYINIFVLYHHIVMSYKQGHKQKYRFQKHHQQNDIEHLTVDSYSHMGMGQN